MTETRGADYYAAQASSFETLYKGLDWIQDNGVMEGADFTTDGTWVDDTDRPLYGDLIKELGLNQDDDVSEDSILEVLDEMPLCIDVRKVYIIRLTFGGPNAQIEVTTYGGVIQSMEYTFGWGSENYSKRLTEHDAMGRYAAEQVERMIECEQ